MKKRVQLMGKLTKSTNEQKLNSAKCKLIKTIIGSGYSTECKGALMILSNYTENYWLQELDNDTKR